MRLSHTFTRRHRHLFFSFLPLISMALFISAPLQAADLQWFKNNFEYVRNSQGEVVKIVDRSLFLKRSLKNEIKVFYRWLREMSQKYQGEEISEKMIEQELTQAYKADLDEDQMVRSSKHLLKFLNFHQEPELSAINEEKFDRWITKVEADIEKALPPTSYQVVANLVDHGYFYKREILRTIIRQAIDLAGSSLPQGRFVDLAIFFVKRFENYVYENRRYHQFMLAYVLNNHTPQELGLTQNEWMRARSSVMESETSWYSIMDHLRARRNWEEFGQQKMDSMLKTGTERKEKYAEKFSAIGSNSTLVHSPVTLTNSESAVADFFTKKSILDKRVSLSYYFAHPKKVLAKRFYYELVTMAYELVNLPFGSGTILRYYTRSKYQSQVRREGSLFAYYHCHEDQVTAKNILKQTVNPVAYLMASTAQDLGL